MGPGGENDDGSNGGSTASLARSLRALKRRGSNLLIVGIVSESGYDRLCGRMLGTDNAGPRRRVLVVTGADCKGLNDRVERVQRPPAETVSYITYSAARQDETADGEPSTNEIGGGNRNREDGKSGRKGNRSLPNEHRVEAGNLERLAGAIEAEIDAIEAEHGTLGPSELRLCVDSAVALLDVHDRAAVIEFLSRVTERVETSRGMGHVHLPVDPGWEAIGDLEELFDAVVQLRIERGDLQQRWYLRETDLTSKWFGV